MIIVTGATGQLGSRIAGHLLTRVPADQIGVSVRDPATAAALTARGVRVRRGDFTDPASLAAAFEGATQVLVVSAMVTGAAAVDVHAAAIDAAVQAGARRVLYTSHQAAGPGSLFAPMPDHAATERYLAGTGVAYTALRNGFYATSLPWMIGDALRTGEIVAPADGPVSWTMHEDLAEAAAMILAGEATFDGPTPPLTAPRALDLEDVAGLLGEISGRTIRRVVADDEEYAAGLVAAGVPAARAQMTLGLYRAARRGEFATTAPDLEKLLGRPATPITAVLS
jgi:NAD(P)H dehydrogenase (quinone)